jgi:hypothetical protein
VVASKEARREACKPNLYRKWLLTVPPHIRQIGMSNFGPKGLRRIDKLMQERSCKVHSNQVRFALQCRSFSASFRNAPLLFEFWESRFSFHSLVEIHSQMAWLMYVRSWRFNPSHTHL